MGFRCHEVFHVAGSPAPALWLSISDTWPATDAIYTEGLVHDYEIGLIDYWPVSVTPAC